MTIMPMWKICPKCHRRYNWNPDVGRMNCPYCQGLFKKKKGILQQILENRSNTDR